MPEHVHTATPEHREAVLDQAETRAALALAPCSWCDDPTKPALVDCPMPWRHADHIAEVLAATRPDVIAALSARAATCGHTTTLLPGRLVACIEPAGHPMPHRSAEGTLWRPCEPWPVVTTRVGRRDDPDGGEQHG